MLYVHTIGRIGKDCQVITGAHGSFIAFDIAVDDYSHGNSITTWVRVRSKKENHIRLSEYLTKGSYCSLKGHFQLHCGRIRMKTVRFNYPLRQTHWSSSIPESVRVQLQKQRVRQMPQVMYLYHR